jgi:uncharacterized protein
LKDETFPSALEACLVLAALLLVEYLIGAALHDFRRPLDLSRNEIDVFVTLLGNGVIFTVLMHMKRLSYGNLFHASPTSVRATLLFLVPPIFLLIPAMVLLASEIVEAIVAFVPISRAEQQWFERMSDSGLPAVVATCILAPVLEEMLFRGIILRAFLHQYVRSKAIFLSAFLFGVAHLNIYQFVVAFLVGLLAGWLYERTRSLLPCIALHGFYNSSLVLQSAVFGADTVQVSIVFSAALWFAALIAAAIGGEWLRRLLTARNHGSMSDAGRSD